MKIIDKVEYINIINHSGRRPLNGILQSLLWLYFAIAQSMCSILEGAHGGR